MQEGFWKEHRKLCISAGAVIVILTGVYLYAMFLPGLWYKDTFLYRQRDGSYAGSDSYADYRMEITRTEEGADINFTVNGTVKSYRVLSNAAHSDVKIYENDELIFTGSAIPAGEEYYLLLDENGELNGGGEVYVSVGNTYKEEVLFPVEERLYNWGVAEKDDIRGDTSMIFGILICAGFLIIDIKFPRFFFFLDHGLAVDGGEPSDWYLFWQKVGRAALGMAIFICIILSFAAH